MESKDAIFFDKNVEASVAIVPSMLCLLLPANQDEDVDDGGNDDDDGEEACPNVHRW